MYRDYTKTTKKNKSINKQKTPAMLEFFVLIYVYIYYISRRIVLLPTIAKGFRQLEQQVVLLALFVEAPAEGNLPKL